VINFSQPIVQLAQCTLLTVVSWYIFSAVIWLKSLNEAFLKLAIGEGLDSGIIDPTQLNVKDIKDLDFEINKYKLAKNLLLGNDEFAMNYISAYRSGEL